MYDPRSLPGAVIGEYVVTPEKVGVLGSTVDVAT